MTAAAPSPELPPERRSVTDPTPDRSPRRSVRRGPRTVLTRTLGRAWGHSIFGMAAQAAFWQTLSLPPLLLGLLGATGYVGRWFGPGTPELVEAKILAFGGHVFSPAVVDQVIAPTVRDVLASGHGSLISFGFVLSLWAGSSAVASFVDSIGKAHGQDTHRHPVWQRIVGLGVYVAGLVVAVVVLPLVAIGPQRLIELFPARWEATTSVLVQAVYTPVVAVLLLLGLTSLYKVALPRPLPWHRLVPGALLAGVFFVTASSLLRIYLGWVTSTGYTYGALAAPIAYLLFTFFLGFAIVLGAELNATVQELWPARATRLTILRERVAEHATGGPVTPRTGPMTGPVSTQIVRLGARASTRSSGRLHLDRPDERRHDRAS